MTQSRMQATYERDQAAVAHRRAIAAAVHVDRKGQVFLPSPDGTVRDYRFIGTVTKDNFMYRAVDAAGQDRGICGYRAEAIEQLLRAATSV